MPAVKRLRPITPENFHDRERFFEPASALALGHAEAGEFALAITQADTEDEFAAGNYVEDGDLLGDQHRMMQGKKKDAGADGAVGNLGDQPRQERHRFPAGALAAKIVLAGPNRIEAGIARRLGEVDDRVEVGYGIDAIRMGH